MNWPEVASLNGLEYFREYARHARRGVVIERDGVLITSGDPPKAAFANAGARLDQSVPPEQVFRILREDGRGRALPLRIAGDEDIEDAARARGWMVLDAPVLMLDSSIPAPEIEGVDIRWGETPDDLEAWGAVAAAAYVDNGFDPEITTTYFADPALLHDPRYSFVVAREDGEAVGAAGVFMSHTVGHVTWVATIASHRRRGIGDACTRLVTNLACEQGEGAYLMPSRFGYRVYQRMGYREFGRAKVVGVPPA